MSARGRGLRLGLGRGGGGGTHPVAAVAVNRPVVRFRLVQRVVNLQLDAVALGVPSKQGVGDAAEGAGRQAHLKAVRRLLQLQQVRRERRALAGLGLLEVDLDAPKSVPVLDEGLVQNACLRLDGVVSCVPAGPLNAESSMSLELRVLGDDAFDLMHLVGVVLPAAGFHRLCRGSRGCEIARALELSDGYFTKGALQGQSATLAPPERRLLARSSAAPHSNVRSVQGKGGGAQGVQRFHPQAGEPGLFAAARAQARECPQVRELCRQGSRTFPAGILAILGSRGPHHADKTNFCGGDCSRPGSHSEIRVNTRSWRASGRGRKSRMLDYV